MKSTYLIPGAFALYFGEDERVKVYFDEVFSGRRIRVICELVLGEILV